MIGTVTFAETPVSKRNTYTNGGVSYAVRVSTMFGKRDVCSSNACNGKADCNNVGCDNGCNTTGRCHPNLYRGCPGRSGCEANKRDDGTLVLVRKDTGAVIGSLELD